jgi:DUF4097 and DUF4098 domain-containing protein YvlB
MTMKIGGLVTLLLLACLEPVTGHAAVLEKKFSAKGLSSIEIQLTTCSVRAMAWTSEEVTVQWEGTVAPPMQVESTRLKIGRPHKQGESGPDCDLKVFMPGHLRLSIETATGRIVAQGLVGRLQLVSVSGCVKVSSCGGPVHINTVSGDVDIREVKADVSIDTVSGEVDVRDLNSALFEVKSVSGDLRLREIQARQLRLNSYSGDITFSGTLTQSGSLDAKNFSGSMAFTLTDGLELSLEAKARYGKVRVRYPLDSVERASNWVRGQSGAGGSMVRLSTYSGDIIVRSTGSH